MESSDKEDLNESLKTYEQQLRTVELALASNPSESQAADLLELKKNLEEVIELTRMTLLGPVEERASTEHVEVHNDIGDNIDEEFAKFQAEMADLGAASEPSSEPTPPVEDLSKMLMELETRLLYSKVQAPYSKGWGQILNHNAIVHSVETSDITHIDDIKVSVMFTHPTVQAMKPCSYFLEGRCKFSAEKCHFSHGHIVSLSELRDYCEPNFESLKPGSKCLVQSGSKDLWQLATMDGVGQEPGHIVVRFTHTGKTTSAKVENVFPLSISEAEDDSSSNDSSDNSGEDVNPPPVAHVSGIEAPMVVWSSKRATGCPLGAWEKHTKGIGSKLMEKMGYVWGEGLGVRGDGRLEPIEAVILPAGKPLDKCIELKELNMAKRSAKAQNKMLLKKKKAEEAIEKRYHAPSKSDTVFDFLNDRIFLKKDAPNEKNCARALKSASSKSLGIEALQVTEAIKKAEREIVRLSQASARNKDKDRVVYAQIEKKIEEQRETIRQLQSKERSILAEQHNRKQNEKLKVF